MGGHGSRRSGGRVSNLVGNALPNFIFGQRAYADGDDFWFGNEDLVPGPCLTQLQNRECVLGQPSDATPWWPRRGNLMGGWDGVDENTILARNPWWGDPWVLGGRNGRLGFVGVTRDQYGSPLGGCTVRCFVTTTDELVARVVSDAAGNFIATTPYGGTAHYLTIHSADGSVAGASVSTLQAS